MLLFPFATLAYAAPPTEEALRARLAEVAPLRAQRLYTAASAPTEADLGTLASGERVGRVVPAPDQVSGRVFGVAVLDVPIAAFWAALNDDEGFVGQSALRYARVLGGTPCQDRKSLLVLDLPVLDDRWFVNDNRVRQLSGGGVRELAWRTLLDPASIPLNAADQAAIDGAVHISKNEGAWWLVQLTPTQVLAEYTSLTDPGGVVPAGPAARFSIATLDDTFDDMLSVARGGASRCR